MSRATFEEQIKNELPKMRREQIVFFAWLCAVRVLPFIGGGGNFNCWGIDNRQKYLYAIFRALDETYAHATGVNVVGPNTDATYPTFVVHDDAKANPTLYSATHAIFYAVSTFYDVEPQPDHDWYVHATERAFGAACSTVKAVEAHYSNSAVANDETVRMQNTLLKSIRDIQNDTHTFDNKLNSYDKRVWEVFRQALKNEGCSHWWFLYKGIFERSFVLDNEALQRRMNVPVQIQDQGAAAVAKHLENE